MKLWGGRFEKETNQMVDDFHSSISFDKRLYPQDIKGSMAHAKMLCKQGIIGPDHRHRQRGKSGCPQHHVKPAFQGSLRLVISRSLPAPEWGVHPVDGWTEWTATGMV